MGRAWLLGWTFWLASSGAVAETKPVYVALGDSFTIGTGGPPERAFPARLAARWGLRLVNLAVNGYTTDDLLARELPEVRAHAPALVTLAIGANDLVRGRSDDGYRVRLRRIFAGLRTAGVEAARVIALPQPDWSLAPVAGAFGERGAIARRIERMNEILREEAARAGARYVDLFAVMREGARSGWFAEDGLHPDARAHQAWAAALAKEVKAP